MTRLQINSCLVCVAILLLPAAVRVPAQEPEAGSPSKPETSPLAVEPTTIEGNLEAALLMVNLARPELARHYLQQILRESPTDEQLLKLRDKHGTATFLELASLEGLNPAASELLELLNAASLRHVGQPGYVESLLPKLTGNARQRAEAMTELQHLGPHAVPPILSSLHRNGGADKNTLIIALTRLGADTIPPLIGGLTAPDDEIRSVSAQVLGVLGSQEDAIWLWKPAFANTEPAGVRATAQRALAKILTGESRSHVAVSSDGSARRLLSAALEHLSGRYEWPESDEDSGDVAIWSWDESAGTLVEHRTNRRLASLHIGERLAREASELAPENEEAPLVVLTALLARDAEVQGWSDRETSSSDGISGARQLALRVGPESCSRVLRLALDQGIPGAALGSLQALRVNGGPRLLQGSRGESSVLAALNAPWPRIQFAAAVTILSWEPNAPFRGAHRVVEILARALNSAASPATIVADPNPVRGNTTASLFADLGYRAEIVRTGMQAFEIAATQGNIELLVLHPNVVRWELSETLANFRADARTARIPVVVYGPPEVRSQVSHHTAHIEKVVFSNESLDPASVHRDIQPLLAQLTPPPLSKDQRVQMRDEAAFWLQRIAVRNVSHVFDLQIAEEALVQSVNQPRIAEEALVALGAIGRPSVQTLLLETAIAPAKPADIREMAALQLAFSIQRFDNLLSPDQGRMLKSAWESETDDRVYAALSGVIGATLPAPAAVRQEILSAPASPAPLPDSSSAVPEN